jgi:hypothetical protein
MAYDPKNATSNAFFFQAAISFVVSFAAVGFGVVSLPVDVWVRSFLGIAMLYVVTSTFTLAKCVRDRQEAAAMERIASGGTPYYAP